MSGDRKSKSVCRRKETSRSMIRMDRRQKLVLAKRKPLEIAIKCYLSKGQKRGKPIEQQPFLWPEGSKLWVR